MNINPYPLGAVTPTPGTPLRITNNESTFAFQVNAITVSAPLSNTGRVWVGIQTLNKTTLAGVFTILEPGQEWNLVMRATGVDPKRFWVDTETAGDRALVVVASL